MVGSLLVQTHGKRLLLGQKRGKSIRGCITWYRLPFALLIHIRIRYLTNEYFRMLVHRISLYIRPTFHGQIWFFWVFPCRVSTPEVQVPLRSIVTGRQGVPDSYFVNEKFSQRGNTPTSHLSKIICHFVFCEVPQDTPIWRTGEGLLSIYYRSDENRPSMSYLFYRRRHYYQQL